MAQTMEIPSKTREIIDLAKNAGLKVYMRKPTDKYAYITNGIGIAYVQWGDYHAGVTTVHIPNQQTGTGFQFSDRITLESIQEAMNTKYPSWATGRDRESVRKYKNWEAFHRADDWNKEMVEVA